MVSGPRWEPDPQTYSFTGDIASLAGPDSTGALSHFMGSDNPNLVIGFDSTGTHNIGRDNPLNPGDSTIENQSGATYHIGVGTRLFRRPLAQNTDTFHGYAAGFAQQPAAAAWPRSSICRRATSPCLSMPRPIR